MRSTTPGQEAATTKKRREPNFYISIDLDDEYEWTTSTPVPGADPGPVLLGEVSGEQATIFVYNGDYRYNQDVIQGAYLGGAVSVSWAYEGEDQIPIFVGFIVSIPDCDDNGWMRVECDRTGPAVVPKGRFLPPIFNHLPPPGYSLEFDGASITIGD